MWEPLPLILYGYAVQPLIPCRRETSRNRLSTLTEASTDDHSVMRDVVPLEVGDEVYAFERYKPSSKEPVDGCWYRGYVAMSRPPDALSLSDPSSTSVVKTSVKAEEAQQVFIGIFPASHIHIRAEFPDAEGMLPELARAAQAGIHGRSNPHVNTLAYRCNKDNASIDMDTIRKAGNVDPYTPWKSLRLEPLPEKANFSRAAVPVYSDSLRSSSPADSRVLKLRPPRPSLQSGDDTASGIEQPIIDEIASALREWHTLMFQYLARRDYKLFHIVRDHIEALHLGRRQLIAQTLSTEEAINMRRDCVARLVRGNLVQGLDVIVRHPTWGGLVTVDIEGDHDAKSWISAIRMYAIQVSLAYLDVNYEDVRPYPIGSSTDFVPSVPLPTLAHSAFPESPHHRNRSRPQAYLGTDDPLRHSKAKFYHVFLDLRAFVASPCAPGETAELFFSLYKKQGTELVTEEFCVILNQNGVLARDPSNRIRTLFVDLTASDIQDSVYLVCRIVRNGASKIGSNSASGFSTDNGWKSSEMPNWSEGVSPTNAWNDSGITHLMNPSCGTASDGHPQFRRPFGCAVLELTQLRKMISEQAEFSSLKIYTMPIYVPANDASFSMIHQNIINNNIKEFEKSPRAETLAVSIKAFRGDAKTVVRENRSLLQDTPQTLRLDFPDVVFPGDVRNELYIKLLCGDFTASHVGPGRLSVAGLARGQMGLHSVNIQITVEVKNQNGVTIRNVISQGSGEPLMTHFHSMVFQRCNKPTFGELIKIQLPINLEIPQWHLFFTFRNLSSRSSNKVSSDIHDRPFAFAFQPLIPEASAFVEDGSHTLVMYRADKLGQFAPTTYLSAPSCIQAGQKPEQLVIPLELFRVAPPLKDTLTIRSSLCSTTYTQNGDLLKLLSWEKQDRDSLSNLLTKFTFVGEGEIVKFLREIFDSLFGILVSQSNLSSELDYLVFNALVTVLGIVQDRRFSNFQPVLNVYIEEHFNCPAASIYIIRSMNRLLTNPTSAETASSLRAALKVWHYIFKFIARSRQLQKAKDFGMSGGATADYLEATFKRELCSHLSAFTQMMSSSSPPSIIGTQTLALQHFTSILPELAKIFKTDEIVSIAKNFANAVTSVGRGKIVVWKLIMYLQIIKGFLFDDPESRPRLVEAVLHWIEHHFGRYEEDKHITSRDTETARDTARVNWLESIRLCVTIVAVMLDKLLQNLTNTRIISDHKLYLQEQKNIKSLLPLLPRFLESYREIQSPASKRAIEKTQTPSTIRASLPVTFPESYPFSLITSLPKHPPGVIPTPKEADSVLYTSLGEAAVVFLVLILSSPIKNITTFLESSLDNEQRERYIGLIFRVATSILENEAFPKTWMNVNILAHKVLIKIMEPISFIMKKEFIPSQKLESRFNANFWREGLHMLLKLLSSKQLVIEEFSPQKRRAVWRLAGDIRGVGASILLDLWQALGSAEHTSTNGEPAMRYGGYQVYLQSLVGHIVNMCFSRHDQLRNNAVQILYSMIVSEYHQSEHFYEIEHVLMARLDSLYMSDSKGDDISRGFFIKQLRHLFDISDVDEQLRFLVYNFLDSVDCFLELLLSVRALPDGDEYADDRVLATLRLMNFIRRTGRDEIYIKYVHQLVNMHLESQNYVEAALTLKLHSDLHEWDLNSFIGPMECLSLPQQSHFERKETLCLLILDYLNKGKAWESAIEICKELACQHAKKTFNYGRLSEILQYQAVLLKRIVTETRYYPDYYRVAFYGNFPIAIKDKRFIYRGYEWEKFGAFCERMLNKHPGAQLLKAGGDPPLDIRNGDAQYIQCTAVTPEPDRSLPVFTNPDVPLAVRTYYEHSAINSFSSSRQIKKTRWHGIEETWLEKIFYTTEEVFPSVIERSEVITLEVAEISPLENALHEVEEKTEELAGLLKKYQALAKTGQDVTTNLNALAMSLNSAVDAPLNTGIASYRQIFFSPDYVACNPERAEMVGKLHSAIDDQVRIIDSCLKLHGHLCSPGFISFHETIEKFFKKNFRDEIRRLAVDGSSDFTSGSSHEQSANRNIWPSSTAPFGILEPPLESPTNSVYGGNGGNISPTTSKQTPLQQHLAHFTRHGINGLSSAPGDLIGSSDLSFAESPHNSFVNIGNGIHGTSAAQMSGSSVTASYVGSVDSFGSLMERFSRFGSLNFSRSKGAF